MSDVSKNIVRTHGIRADTAYRLKTKKTNTRNTCIRILGIVINLLLLRI